MTSSLSEEERSQVFNVFLFMTEDDHDNFYLHNDDEEVNHHNDGDGGVRSSFITYHDNSGEGGDGDWRSELPHLWVSDPITFSSA